jgi:DNA-binding response OmpR family regulator
MSGTSNTVLVVDDEPGLADLYAAWLEAEYNVRTAYGGVPALDELDARVDVVLLDRRMPDLSGDEVLEEIREQGFGCGVAMVTAVEPDFDIVEMGFDGYVVKPVNQNELLSTVERMVEFEDIGPGARAYYARVAKKTALESQKDPGDLDANSEFASLQKDVQVFGGVIVSLAEEALDQALGGFVGGDRPDVRVELREWRDRLDALNEGDPLYAVAEERVAELESMSRTEDGDAIEPFLEAVADGFIAEDVWLDQTVQRALNMLFYNKNSETFVINRKPIADVASDRASTKFDVSQEVRRLASAELDSLH